MTIVELIPGNLSHRATLSARGLFLVGGTQWVKIYNIKIHGKRPPMSLDPDNLELHFLTFGTGMVNPDTMISLYHMDQGSFPTQLLVPRRQNATLGLRATAGKSIDWTLDVEFWWTSIEEPKRWL